ncbi:hypothetical protein HRG_012900 [Hirsutella rhossiliensis]
MKNAAKCDNVISTLEPVSVLGPHGREAAPKCIGDPAAASLRSSSQRTSHRKRGGGHAVKQLSSWKLTSDQVGIPAELKHINKRRKRNQQGLPQ